MRFFKVAHFFPVLFGSREQCSSELNCWKPREAVLKSSRARSSRRSQNRTANRQDRRPSYRRNSVAVAGQSGTPAGIGQDPVFRQGAFDQPQRSLRVLATCRSRAFSVIESIEPRRCGTARLGKTRSSLRKPPSAAYAAFSPPLYYADTPGEGKCTHCFIGGNFSGTWPTGLRLQSPTAMQAQGSPLNPLEMANPDPACVVRRVSLRPYRALFETIWGPRAFAIAWPENVDEDCSRPNTNPASAIGSEVPGPNDTPLVVALAPEDRARVQSTFDQIANPSLRSRLLPK